MIDTPAFQARKARLGDATSKIGNGADPSLKDFDLRWLASGLGADDKTHFAAKVLQRRDDVVETFD